MGAVYFSENKQSNKNTGSTVFEYSETAANSGAWNITGNKIEIIPSGAIAYPFDLHWINISEISAASHFVIDLFPGLAGSEVLIASTRGWRNVNFFMEGAKMIQIPQQPAGNRISARLSDSTSGTITVSVGLEGHLYGA